MAINPAYFKEENIRKIQQMFSNNSAVPSIVLHQFFDKAFYEQLKKEMRHTQFKRARHLILYSYQKAPLPKKMKTVLDSKVFVSFIARILNKKIGRIEATAQCFSWKDYTILNDEAIEKPGIDLIIGFSDDWNEQAGGTAVYVDGTGEYTKTPVKGNMLVIVKRKQGVQKFVQYLNHYAHEKQLLLVIGTLH